ncbi:MAG: hypothetical protein ABI640_21930 [Gammaproteobacteria bacterium]
MTIESLYDNPTSGIAQPEAKKTEPAPVAGAVDATKLFDTMKPAAEKRDPPPAGTKVEPDAAAKLYGDSAYNDTVLLTDVPAGATAEQIDAANSDVRQQFAAMELPGPMAREITAKFTAAMRAPIDDATYDKRVASFKTELERKFGSEVEERLQDVRTLLAKADPAVVTALVESGLNVDVDTIVALAGHARALKGRGRL